MPFDWQLKGNSSCLFFFVQTASTKRGMHHHRPRQFFSETLTSAFDYGVICYDYYKMLLQDNWEIYVNIFESYDMRPNLWLWWNVHLGKELDAFFCKLAFCSRTNAVVVLFAHGNMANWATIMQILMFNVWIKASMLSLSFQLNILQKNTVSSIFLTP